MAIDNKYGRVILERSTIGEKEPVVVFRAQDKLLPKVLDIYRFLCEIAGSPPRHLELISDSAEKIRAWQQENFTQTPQSKQLEANE
jgi:hypothetical protein